MTEAVAADFLPVLAAESPTRSFVVSVHDVAPATREASGKIIAALKDAGVRTASLLVVPNYHHQGALPRIRLLCPGCAILKRAATRS